MSFIAPTRTPTWFYLCHHISLSGGKAALMTRRLLALCFGSPVNAGHADGISPAKASLLSVYNNCCVLLSSTRRSAHSTTGLRRLTPRQRRAGSGKDVDGLLEREESVVTIVSNAEFLSELQSNVSKSTQNEANQLFFHRSS